MRRLLALIPAVMLVFALSPAAHADQPTSMTDTCKGNDGSTLGSSTTIKFVPGTDSQGHAVLVLLSVKSVINGCNVEYADLQFASHNDGDQVQHIYIAPGANRTLGPAVLQKLGLYNYRFRSWGWTIRTRLRNMACVSGIGMRGFVDSSNHVTVCPQS